MKYLKKIVGENCYLTPASPEYAEKVAAWSNDMEVAINTGDVSDMISYEKQREYLEGMCERGYAFIIVRKSDDEMIGLCRLMGIDLINKRATLGIFIGEKNYWSMGIGTEATKMILDFGFNILNLKNIMLQVYSFNERAIKAYEKCGFKEIGRRRKSIILGGREYDEVYMDILAEEFKGEIVNKVLG